MGHNATPPSIRRFVTYHHPLQCGIDPTAFDEALHWIEHLEMLDVSSKEAWERNYGTWTNAVRRAIAAINEHIRQQLDPELILQAMTSPAATAALRVVVEMSDSYASEDLVMAMIVRAYYLILLKKAPDYPPTRRISRNP